MASKEFEKELSSIASFCAGFAKSFTTSGGLGRGLDISEEAVFQTCVKAHRDFWTHKEIQEFKEAFQKANP